MGIAGQLLEVFLHFAQANDLAFLTLEVRPSNAARTCRASCSEPYVAYGATRTGPPNIAV